MFVLITSNAQESGEYESLKTKFQNGEVQVNDILIDSKTIFHLACERKDIDILKSIMEDTEKQSAKFEDLYYDSLSTFDLLCLHEMNDVLFEYLKLVQDLDKLINTSPIVKYCGHHRSIETFIALIEMGFTISDDTYSHLIQGGNIEMIKYIEEANLFSQYDKALDLKFYALLSGNCEMINYFFQKSEETLNSNFEPKIKTFVRFVNIYQGMDKIEETLSILIKNGVDINEVDHNGNNALYNCGDNIDLFKLLIQCGVSTTNINLEGNTLEQAIMEKYSFFLEGSQHFPSGSAGEMVNKKLELLND